MIPPSTGFLLVCTTTQPTSTHIPFAPLLWACRSQQPPGLKLPECMLGPLTSGLANLHVSCPPPFLASFLKNFQRVGASFWRRMGGAEERQEPGSQATWVLGQVRLLSRLCVLICQMGTQQPAQTPLCDGWENPVSRKYQGFVNYEELNSVMGVQPLRSHASCLP